MLLLFAQTARADLTITPVRVVFQERDRAANVTLLNVTDRANTYRMGWMIMKMDAHGDYHLAHVENDADPTSVANMVIFSPRQVTIQPHAYQTVRLSLRRPADLPPGEYRAHLSFTRLSTDVPAVQDPNEKGRHIALNVNLSFSIPVIVRSGDDKDLKISLSSPKLTIGGTIDTPTPELKIDINRDAGRFSSYGTLYVYAQTAHGTDKQIGMLSNVALYPEVQHRSMVVPLTESPRGGMLHVVYKGKYESEGTVWDDKTFPIGQ